MVCVVSCRCFACSRVVLVILVLVYVLCWVYEHCLYVCSLLCLMRALLCVVLFGVCVF